MSDKRDWQADMALCEKATQEPWVPERAKLLPWSTVYPRDSFKFICERVKHEDADFIAESRTALPYWLQEVKKLCEVNQQEQRKILGLHIRLNAEKQRADIAELAYQGLAENAVNRGEYQSLLDKHTAMTKAYWDEKERADNLERERDEAVSALTESYNRLKEQESELKETMKWAIEQSKWGDPENALDKIVSKLQNTLSTLYPKEETE